MLGSCSARLLHRGSQLMTRAEALQFLVCKASPCFFFAVAHNFARRAGGTNKALDLQNPDNLGAQSTDSGVVPNLKWSFSDSRTRLLNGGWVREQVITDLPASHDISAAQQHLKKGAIRELHWHRVVSSATA